MENATLRWYSHACCTKPKSSATLASNAYFGAFKYSYNIRFVIVLRTVEIRRQVSYSTVETLEFNFLISIY